MRKVKIEVSLISCEGCPHRVPGGVVEDYCKLTRQCCTDDGEGFPSKCQLEEE